MEELYALVDLINKNKIKRISIIQLEKKKRISRYDELYELLIERKFKDELEAAEYFFPEQLHKKKYFSNLKSKFRTRLINTCLFLDVNQSQFSSFQRAYYSCIRYEAIIKVLLGQYLRQPAIRLAERTLNRAIKFELTDTALFLSRTLKLHYGSTVGNTSKYKKYSHLFDKYLNLQRLEMLAEEFYADITFYSANSRENNKSIASKAKEYSEELYERTLNHESHKLMLYRYMVHVLALQLNNDLDNAILVCREAINYFSSKKKLASPNIKIAFNFRILACLTNLGRFQEAKLSAIEYLKLVKEGTWNWYVGMQYYLIAAFHMRDFGLAKSVLKNALGHSGFKKLYQNRSEEWLLYSGYMKYLIQVRKIAPSPNSQPIKFRINKFLNEVPIYSKDKRGTNITIIILQILFLLQQKKYGKIIDRVESIKMYAHRYLRRNDTFRSNCFIKMLVQLPAASFHKAGVSRKAANHFKLLKESANDPSTSNTEVEIIPYEFLWECVLDSLQNKHARI